MKVERSEKVSITVFRADLIAMLQREHLEQLSIQALPPTGSEVDVSLVGTSVVLTYVRQR